MMPSKDGDATGWIIIWVVWWACLNPATMKWSIPIGVEQGYDRSPKRDRFVVVAG